MIHGTRIKRKVSSTTRQYENQNDATGTLQLPEDYKPNDLLLNDVKKTSKLPMETQHITQMTESSYTNYNSPFSDYQRKRIHDMANSIVNEANALFGNQDDVREMRPYEEQKEFQSSRAKNYRSKQIAKNITSKYSTGDD